MAAVLDEKLVEKIVGEVMTRIRPTSQPVRTALPLARHSPLATQPSANSQPSATFAIVDRVVTAELLASRLNGQKWAKVAICPKAVITPSAFDYLRTHKIVWHRNTAEAAPSR